MKIIYPLICIALIFSSCQNISQGETSSSNNSPLQNSSITETLPQNSTVSSGINSSSILWGDTSDQLKYFDDHDGSIDFYSNYTFFMEYKSSDVRVNIPLDNSTLGSQFLTSLHELNPLEDKVDFLFNGTSLTLTVEDNSNAYRYILQENGEIYTIQQGKTYYLGNKSSLYSGMLGTFIVNGENTIKTAHTEILSLPPFNPYDDKIAYFNTTVNLANKIEYNSQTYNTTISLTNYGEPGLLIPIKNQTAKDYLLKTINSANTFKDFEATMGSGIIIRIWEGENYYNYLLCDDVLVDFSSNISLKIDSSDFGSNLREIVANELANTIKELNL